MDFQTTILKKKYRQRITVEIDIFGDEEIDSTQAEKIADSFTNFVRQLWCLADPKIDFACSSNVKVQLPQPKSHEQVKLPCTHGNGQVNIS